MKLTPRIKKEFAHIVGPANVQTDALSLSLYAYDCALSRTQPDGVIQVTHAYQIAPLLRICAKHHIPFVVRASATNHAGSCTALRGGVILNVTALNRILQIDTQAGFAVVQPGVITGDLQAALAPLGYFYAPDPASAFSCTIGGNLAQNASGARCMKYGGTLNHVLQAQVVLADGTEVSLSRTQGGPDLIGLLAGSEGTLGIFTQLTVKILPIPKHIQTFLVTFPSLAQSIQAVSALAAHGIIPRCVEAMDKTTLRAVEDFSHAGYPTDVEALLILELDGTPAQIKKESLALEKICREHSAQKLILAKTEQERQQLWQGRRSAYAAMSRLSPNVMVGDGTVPRSQLPAALSRVQQILQNAPLQAGLLFHAGDGNFHPHILFDQRNNFQTRTASQLLQQILKVCVQEQGSISGEHGVGVEKRALMAYQYDGGTLTAMARIKHALDPQHLANPLKILPQHFLEKARLSVLLSAQEEVLQQQLRTWKKEHTSFVIVGQNSKLKTTAQNILSSRSLDQLLEIDTANYTVTTQAGIELTTLCAALKKAKLYSILPDTKGTLGGLFCAGILPSFYAHVLGIRALLPDGTAVSYGGKFMKNAAGYPLTRLWAGSQGTFGLVTQLTFQVFAQKQKPVACLPFQPAAPNEIWTRLQRTLQGVS